MSKPKKNVTIRMTEEEKETFRKIDGRDIAKGVMICKDFWLKHNKLPKERK